MEQARHYDRAAQASSPAEAASLRVDKALVNVGSMFLENVSGRVSTEVDPRAHDSEGAAASGQGILACAWLGALVAGAVSRACPTHSAACCTMATPSFEPLQTHVLCLRSMTFIPPLSDPRLSLAEALVARGQSLIRLYEEVGVSRDRVVLRIPATWAGIRAAAALEAEGIATHLVLVYGFTQGAAAAQAGVSVIQPNVGAVADWYKRHPGVIKNPKVGLV